MIPSLKIELTFDETNKVLGSLGKQPFEEVAALIQKFQVQAQPQLPALEAAMREQAEKQAAEKADEKTA